jgi:ribosomal protein S18 acetylase RimI-like enzyme
MAELHAFTIRPMRNEDLDQALSLSMAEGWNQTDKDWKLLIGNRHNVCVVAEKDQRLAGTATAINYENKIAWIGMVLVDKSVRGMGAGKMLLEHIIGKLRHIRSVKLDATPAGEALYTKLGFKPEYKLFRMKRDAGNFSSAVSPIENVRSIDKKIFEDIVRLDKVAFGVDRSYLLNNLLNNYPEKALCLKNKNGTGYIFGRDGSQFSYMGPVIANSQKTAECLIAKALESLTGQASGVDVPEYREQLIKWLESVGFVIQRHFTRMYLNTNPFPGQLKNQYLISGPEYG